MTDRSPASPRQETGPRQARLRATGYALASLVLLALAGGVVAWVIGGQSSAGARSAAEDTARGTLNYGNAPSYQLTDQNGREFSSTQLAGKVQVVTYLFPYCTSFCPTITRTIRLAEIEAARAGLAGKVNYVAFNVDPAGSGPRQMRAFLQEYGVPANDPSWHFLTGSPAVVRRVVTGGFHIYYRRVTLASEARTARREKRNGTYQPQPDVNNPLADRAKVNYDIVHNDSVEVIGPNGRITSLFASADKLSAARLLQAIRTAANSS